MKSNSPSIETHFPQTKKRRNLLRLATPLLFSWMLGSAALTHAADGSGTNIVTPDSVEASSPSNDFNFLYTPSEAMADGTLELNFPDTWADPSLANINVIVTNGQTGQVIDSLDNNPPTGWSGSVIGICPGCQITLSTDTDANDVFAGTGSLQATVAGLAGIAYDVNIVYGFGQGQEQDWSDFTDFSFYIRNDALLALTLFNAGQLFITQNNTIVSYPLLNHIVDTQVLGTGGWSQVLVDLTSNGSPVLPSTRSAVLSYGFSFPGVVNLLLSLNGTIHIDQIMAGPSGPTFNGNVLTQNFLYLDADGSVEIQYQNITAPDQAGFYLFNTRQSLDSGGTLTDLQASPVIEVTAATDSGDTVGGNGGTDAGDTGSDDGSDGQVIGQGEEQGTEDDVTGGGGCSIESSSLAGPHYAGVASLLTLLTAALVLRGKKITEDKGKKHDIRD